MKNKQKIIVIFSNDKILGKRIFNDLFESFPKEYSSIQYYFDKEANELNVPESALLVGMLKGTSYIIHLKIQKKRLTDAMWPWRR